MFYVPQITEVVLYNKIKIIHSIIVSYYVAITSKCLTILNSSTSLCYKKKNLDIKLLIKRRVWDLGSIFISTVSQFHLLAVHALTLKRLRFFLSTIYSIHCLTLIRASLLQPNYKQQKHTFKWMNKPGLTPSIPN